MRRRGFSLVEALGSLLVMSILLTAVAALMQSYASISRRTSARDQAVVSAVLASEHLRNEVSAAVKVLHPAGATAEAQLEFQRIDPNYQPATTFDRMPSPLAPPLPSSFDPYDPATLLTVQYQLQGDRLVRITTEAGGRVTQTVVATGLIGFSVRRQGEADPAGAGCVEATMVYGSPVPNQLQVHSPLCCLSRIP